MRTTLTLDDDLFMALNERARATGRSFKEVVNEALRRGLFDTQPRREISAPTLNMGAPRMDVTKALDLAMRTDNEWEQHR
jgi:predicted transcriptional regulator